MRHMRHTHTVATLPVSRATWEEIAGKLRAAGYDHVFSREGAESLIDMTGIGLVVEEEPRAASSPAAGARFTRSGG